MAFASRDPNKRDADHVDFWLPLFERALSDFVRTKQKSREKYRQLLGQYESEIKSALKSEGGRNRLRESGWSEEKMRREIEQAVSKVVENAWMPLASKPVASAKDADGKTLKVGDVVMKLKWPYNTDTVAAIFDDSNGVMITLKSAPRAVIDPMTEVVKNKAIRTTNAVGRDKQDAASVEMWIGLFNNFLNWSLKKHGDPAKARKNGETILKNIEDSLNSDGGREQLKKMGWTMQKLRDALEKGLRERFVQNSVRTTNPIVRKALNSVSLSYNFYDAAKNCELAIRAIKNGNRADAKELLGEAKYNAQYVAKEKDADAEDLATMKKSIGLLDTAIANIWSSTAEKDIIAAQKVLRQGEAQAKRKPPRTNAVSVATNAQFKVGDIVEAMRPQVHKLGVKGTVTRVKPDTIIVKWHDDGFEAQYGIEGNFKSATPKQVVAPEQKLREELMQSGYGRDRDSAIGWLTAHRRGLVTKYGRDIYEKVRSETASNATGDQVIATRGKFKLVYNPINEGYWFYIGTYGEGLQDSSGRPIFGKDKKSVAMDEFKRLVATANARAMNAAPVAKTKNAVVAKALNAMARNYDVKPGWTNRWSGELKPGTKIMVVDSPIRYGGMAGKVVRRDGLRYVVRLDDIAGMEVWLNPNQISVKNADTSIVEEKAVNAKFKVGDLVKVYRGEPPYIGIKGRITKLWDRGSLTGEPDMAEIVGEDGRFSFGLDKLMHTFNSVRTTNAKDANGKEIKVGSLVRPKTMRPGTEDVVKSIEGDKVWYTSTYGNVWEYAKNLIVANARACNGKWVVLYRDGGKEKIDAPSHAEAKKIADEKSKKSGRGYISVIVDDGVDYGINATNERLDYMVVVDFPTRREITSPLFASEWAATVRAKKIASTTKEKVLVIHKPDGKVVWENATRNAVVAKALNASAATNREFKPGDKVCIGGRAGRERGETVETIERIEGDGREKMLFFKGSKWGVPARMYAYANAEAVCNERYLVQTLEGDRWETKKTTPSRMDADSYMRVYQRSYSLSDVRIIRASDGAEIARG